MLGFLLNYITHTAAVIIFAVIVILLITGRKKLPTGVRVLLVFLLLPPAAYFAFVIWASVAAGKMPPAATPHPL